MDLLRCRCWVCKAMLLNFYLVQREAIKQSSKLIDLKENTKVGCCKFLIGYEKYLNGTIGRFSLRSSSVSVSFRLQSSRRELKKNRRDVATGRERRALPLSEE